MEQEHPRSRILERGAIAYLVHVGHKANMRRVNALLTHSPYLCCHLLLRGYAGPPGVSKGRESADPKP